MEKELYKIDEEYNFIYNVITGENVCMYFDLDNAKLIINALNQINHD